MVRRSEKKYSSSYGKKQSKMKSNSSIGLILKSSKMTQQKYQSLEKDALHETKKNLSRFRKDFENHFFFFQKNNPVLYIPKNLLQKNNRQIFYEDIKILLFKFLIQNGTELLLPKKYNLNKQII